VPTVLVAETQDQDFHIPTSQRASRESSPENPAEEEGLVGEDEEQQQPVERETTAPVDEEGNPPVTTNKKKDRGSHRHRFTGMDVTIEDEDLSSFLESTDSNIAKPLDWMKVRPKDGFPLHQERDVLGWALNMPLDLVKSWKVLAQASHSVLISVSTASGILESMRPFMHEVIVDCLDQKGEPRTYEIIYPTPNEDGYYGRYALIHKLSEAMKEYLLKARVIGDVRAKMFVIPFRTVIPAYLLKIIGITDPKAKNEELLAEVIRLLTEIKGLSKQWLGSKVEQKANWRDMISIIEKAGTIERAGGDHFGSAHLMIREAFVKSAHDFKILRDTLVGKPEHTKFGTWNFTLPSHCTTCHGLATSTRCAGSAHTFIGRVGTDGTMPRGIGPTMRRGGGRSRGRSW